MDLNIWQIWSNEEAEITEFGFKGVYTPTRVYPYTLEIPVDTNQETINDYDRNRLAYTLDGEGLKKRGRVVPINPAGQRGQRQSRLEEIYARPEEEWTQEEQRFVMRALLGERLGRLSPSPKTETNPGAKNDRPPQGGN